MNDALLRLSQQSGLRVLFRYEAVSSLRAGEIKGWYSTRDALEKLIAGRPLRMTMTHSGAVVLMPMAGGASVQPTGLVVAAASASSGMRAPAAEPAAARKPAATATRSSSPAPAPPGAPSPAARCPSM
jgi:iron complex outermembrane receptor protein